mmetsp:Transcript_3089/g.8851  ORF Transcript_3089/g.8851 Transcript_3089/m.8851 type:complete len:164 (+) Transcript_3089:81-572(+)
MAMMVGRAAASLVRSRASALPPAIRRPHGQFAMLARGFSETRFAKTHEWVQVDGEVGTLGISDFAQGQLGEVVYCDLPDEGATFKASETLCTLESVKAVGEVYAPAACEAVSVNEKLSDEPSLVNKSPESDGWLVKIKLTGDVSQLLDRAAYDKHVEAESKEE